MPSPVKCSRCRRSIKRVNNTRNISVICLKCGLWGIVLSNAFTRITETSDMVEFNNMMREWYPTDEDSIQSG